MTTITEDMKPKCSVRGLIFKGAMCGHVIVGGRKCGYVGDCEHKRSASEATAPAQPAWHDAPTCSGLWFCDEGDENPYRFTCHNVSIPLKPHLVGEGERWYGPIPPDGDKP